MEKKLFQIFHLIRRINETETYNGQFEYSGNTRSVTIIVHKKSNFSDQIINHYFYTDIITDINPDFIIKELTKLLIKVPEFEKV